MKDLQARVVAFRDARDWKQFNPPKDLALALSIEAAELLEIFRFKSDEQALAGDGRDRLSDELADVLYFVLLMANDTGIDLRAALERKLAATGEKYPVALSRGRNLKYTELSPEGSVPHLR